MTMFPYNDSVPFPTNNPSNDQGQMLINTVSTFGIWAVDHVGYKSTGIIGNPQASGGQHLRVTFNGKNPPGFTPTDPISALYTVSGVASTNSEMRFLNNLNTAFPISLIRAYAVVDTNGIIVASQQINVSSIAKSGPGTSYTVTLVPNAVNDATNYAVFSQATDYNIILNSTPQNATTFIARSSTNQGINQYPTGNWWFMVLQL
jgi:hypothetical protein